ncbi:MAG: hypothetical protein R2817_06010 [Flavobacteriales bacterium]
MERFLQGDAKIGIFAFELVAKLLPMGKDKAFRNMNELLAELSRAERELASGALGVEGLEVACADARELYERLIVLRHKAREAAVAPAAKVVEREEPAPAAAKEPTPDPSAIRLDTRPPDVSPRQVSLIEAIEATESTKADVAPPPAPKPPTAPKPAAAPRSAAPTEPKKGIPTLAEKLEQAAIPDLAKAISLSHKFWFVAELFNGDRITYDKTIDLLNGMADGASAQAYLEQEVLAKLRKPADPEALATFSELLKRRYA